MKLTDRLYRSVQETWPRYLEHPFVVEMAQGQLPLEKFRYYLLQDYVYLRDYLKIFAACIAKADDFAQIRFLCENMTAVLEETKRVHVPSMKRLGITEAEIHAVIPHISNSSYSHYMLCEAQAGSLLTGLVALLSCSWTYAYIGEHMVSRYPHALQHPEYGPWFAGYICDEYRQTNQELMDMVDQWSDDITPLETEKLCHLFWMCSQYELQFWDMAYSADQ